MLLLLISFIAGVLTVLAPCILPLLPVIIGGTLDGGGVNKKKIFTIILSLGLSVIVFTLLLKVSTLFINIPEQTWKYISGGLIIVIGLLTIFPKLWEGQLLARISRKANITLGKGDQKKSFWGDVIVGASLGPVFSTCSPTYFIVLATVLPVNFFLGLLYMFTYVLGLCIALSVVAFIGQKIMQKLNIAANPNGWFKKAFGIVFIIVGIAIIQGYDKKLQISILDSGFFDVTQIEQKLLEKQEAEEVESNNNEDSAVDVPNPQNKILEKENPGTIKLQTENKKQYKKAPELSTIDGYINTGGKQIKLADYRGKKVILLDIWTYSCINCQRTIPYLNSWYEKYHNEGLEIIGLHTPEFAFEKVERNVKDAVDKFKIKYPVVMDNDYSTWNALGNRYWPRKYLIDLEGNIIYDHIGEGKYEETEMEIQKVLNVSKEITKESKNSTAGNTPEIYFGSLRNNSFGNGLPQKTGNFIGGNIDEAKLDANKHYLGGEWNIFDEYSESVKDGSVYLKYKGAKVFIVAESDVTKEIEVWVDGKFQKKIEIGLSSIYTLIDETVQMNKTLMLKVPAKVRLYTFTFG